MHVLLLTVILAACTTTGSAPPQAAGSDPGLLLQVARWQGPGNTVITLQADGSIQRFEGSLLTIRRQGTGSIPAAAARSLLERAEALPGPGPVPTAPSEGDLFLVVTPAGRVLSASEATAASEMRAYIDEVLRVAATIPLRANTETYLRAGQVDPERTMRLRDAGRSAVGVPSAVAARRRKGRSAAKPAISRSSDSSSSPERPVRRSPPTSIRSSGGDRSLRLSATIPSTCLPSSSGSPGTRLPAHGR